MTFRVGQKVVSLGSKMSLGEWFVRLVYPYEFPPKGAVCTISRIETDDEGCWLSFVEKYAYDPRKWSDGFDASRFRPLVEDKSSTFFTEGAPKDSEQFDNRRKIGVVA